MGHAVHSQPRRVIRHQTRGVNAHRHLGDHELHTLKLVDPFSKLLTLCRVPDGQVESALRDAQRVGRHTDPAAIQCVEKDAEPSVFLPQEESGERTLASIPAGGITIDLDAIERLTGTEAEIFDRFLRAIQMMRQDFNGRVLTIRRDDLRMLALLLDQSEEAFAERLTELGLTEAE